jgi:gamma-glutamyl-gamma-aminobutyrate hydrolase PuuD
MRVALTYSDPSKAPPYQNALQLVGLEPVSNPHTLDDLEGLVLAGGTDVNPELYGESRAPETQEPDHERDERELRLIEEALDDDVPILAICRGIQILNVALGGTLVQHIGDTHRCPGIDEAHGIDIPENTLLGAIVASRKESVNSRHHQAIARLGEGLRLNATSAADGIIEAVDLQWHPFVLGVQWHPEDRTRYAADRSIFEAFASAVRSR